MTSGVPCDSIHIDLSDHVPWLEDRKWAYIRMEDRNFGDIPVKRRAEARGVDSPTSAGVVIDAVRCAKVALDRGIGGPLLGPSSYFMKSPPTQFPGDVCRQMVHDFTATQSNATPVVLTTTPGSDHPV